VRLAGPRRAVQQDAALEVLAAGPKLITWPRKTLRSLVRRLISRWTACR
jgi:hypothetical protein